MKKIIDLFILYFYQIAGGVLSLSFGGYVTWRFSQRVKRREAIDKFINIFINEREKIKVFNIQDHNIQERAIFEVSRHLSLWRACRIKRIWNNYQETENKYRQVLHTADIPPNHLIHYGDYKRDVLNKINRIIKYLK